MIKVGVSGANGRMGRLTIGAVDRTADLAIGGLYAPGRDGQEILGHRAGGDPAALSGCDVIVEFTHPAAADENVPRWRDSGAHVLIGTSGYTTARIEELRAQWAGLDSRCLVVPNFAIGVVLMIRFAELAMPHFDSAEIIEMHHHDKPDAPSGTALAIGGAVEAARGGDLEVEAGRGPDSGRRTPGALGYASVRAGDIVGEHTLLLAGAVICVTGMAAAPWDAFPDRSSIAKIVLRAARAHVGKVNRPRLKPCSS